MKTPMTFSFWDFDPIYVPLGGRLKKQLTWHLYGLMSNRCEAAALGHPPCGSASTKQTSTQTRTSMCVFVFFPRYKHANTFACLCACLKKFNKDSILLKAFKSMLSFLGLILCMIFAKKESGWAFRSMLS